MTLAAALLAGLAWGAEPACPPARAKLERFLDGLPRACAKDADCDGYYYRADSHAPAVVLAKPGAPAASEPELLRLQAALRQACREELSRMPASPNPFRAVCRDRACRDAFGLPEPPAPARSTGKRYHATIRRQCAPWDGPALGLTLTEKKAGCSAKPPYVGVSLWRELPPKPNARIEFGSAAELTPNGAGAATRCPKPNACKPVRRGWILFDRFSMDGRVSGTFELEFEDGVEKGSFSATWCPSEAVCG